MKKKDFYTLSLLFLLQILFSQQETKPFVLSKADYQLLEEKNLLVTEAIVNAFGAPSKENNYKLEIEQVDAWNSRIKEFKYFPNPNEENKELLKNKALKYPDNYNIEFRIKINKTKSLLTDALKPYLDKKNSFVVSVTIIGNSKIFVTEVRNTEKFKEMVNERSFVAKALKKRFGDVQKNNYHLKYTSLKACILKDLFIANCFEEFDLLSSEKSYEKFAETVSSDELSGAYILFSVPILRKESKLTPAIEELVIKETDGTEYIKFYFCIPRVSEGDKRARTSVTKKVPLAPVILGSIKGKLLKTNSKTEPIVNETIELKFQDNTVCQTRKTDEQGAFEFKDVDLEKNYVFNLPDFSSDNKETKVYLANINGELIKELTKNEANKFTYKTIEVDLYRLHTMNENDVELSFTKQKEANNNAIVIQDYIYYDINSFKILQESKQTLDKIIKLLNENNGYKLEILSHTDSRGEEQDNLILSQKRSESVMNYLISSGKVQGERIKPLGLGESSPLNSCTNGKNCLEEEFKMNRRTEFVFKRS